MTTASREASDTNTTAKPRENRKSGPGPADREGEREKKHSEKSSVHADAAGGRSDDEGKSRDRRKEETRGDERRPKREREDPPERKERHRERRFREVKERESPRERESSRERSWRPSDRGRWAAEERPKSSREQDQERGGVRGGHRGGRRSFTGGSRQGGGAFAGNQGRYNGGERDSRPGNWGGDRYNGGNRDSSYRRQTMSYQPKGEKWQHDLFETVVDADRNEPEEDPIAKIEALLAS